MNVNEYAEKVLFSTNLDEKLRLSTETIEFDIQQASVSGDLIPGRPDSMLLDSVEKAARASLPSRPSLVDDKNRGTLLHFFANHELLAAELMALALLKFPNAPVEFRKGLFKTLQEEQKHTLWYLGRMKECGVTLGEFPVSRFFWDTVSTMETPFDYVSRLSLTFEQANLDYSRHFGAIMKEAGDPRTARIMEKIYRDEIEHVGYGLKWFRYWKDPEKSDWDAYRSCLSLPLSPSRAKGNGIDFNGEGRRDAGLSEAFVRNLTVYEKSKGRSPNVFYFNPDAEDSIASGSDFYQPDSKIDSLINDLEVLMIFLSRQDDVVLMRKPPSLEHLERLRSAGFQLPEIEKLDGNGNVASGTSLTNRKLSSFKPWSVAPDQPRRFGMYSEDELWNDDWRALFSKVNQAGVFGEWMGRSKICFSENEVEKVASESGNVLKRSIAAAGRGVRFCRSREETLKVSRDWLKAGDGLLVEPAHDRVFDFSVQFEIKEAKMVQVGLIRQLVGPTGRYSGSVSVPKFCKGLPEEISRFLMNEALPYFDVSSPMMRAVSERFMGMKYSGPVGIDSYLYKDSNGNLAFRPICEINPRYTMGRVAHEVRKAVAPGCAVRFQIEKAQPHRVEASSKVTLANGKISSGELCLNEISDSTKFAAIIKVDKDPGLL